MARAKKQDDVWGEDAVAPAAAPASQQSTGQARGGGSGGAEVATAQHSPLSLKDALAALKLAEAMRANTREEGKVKELALAKARADFFKAQQGLPVLAIHANDRVVSAPQAEAVRRERIALRARKDRDLAALLAENEALRKQLAALKG